MAMGCLWEVNLYLCFNTFVQMTARFFFSLLQVYYAPMYKLKLMNEYEFMKIFGCLEVLLALHQGIDTLDLNHLWSHQFPVSKFSFLCLFKLCHILKIV